MIRTVVKTIRSIRSLGRDDLRSYAQGYLDEALASYGYVRRKNLLMRGGPILGAFGAGVAVGTSIGVLIAPRSGAETRELIAKRLESLIEQLKTQAGREAGVEARGVRGEGHIITDDPEITHGGPMGHT